MVVTSGQHYNGGEKPTVLYCILTLITMQRKEPKQRQKYKDITWILLYVGYVEPGDNTIGFGIGLKEYCKKHKSPRCLILLATK